MNLEAVESERRTEHMKETGFQVYNSLKKLDNFHLARRLNLSKQNPSFVE